jgi:antitoxin component YwqK of YwqJK toxin-antitoxin module
MSRPLQEPTRRAKTKWVRGVVGLVLAGALVTLLVRWPDPKPPAPSSAVGPVAVSRTNLVLVEGRLRLSGQTNAFTGLMLDHSAGGLLRSRSAVTNGLLHGLSEGWHTNGQLQVTEHFKDGVSHGVRTKWHPNGAKLSEGGIVDGKFHGTFRRWSESGTLAEQIEFVSGQPHGLSLAYFPSGFLKARMKMKDGKIIEQATWKDGEHKEAAATLQPSASPPAFP